MNRSHQGRYESVDASPVKSFFVSMLTRDIQLEEAILDLLDNCVDGILRSKGSSGPRPYDGFKADITFGADSFSIHDQLRRHSLAPAQLRIQNGTSSRQTPG